MATAGEKAAMDPVPSPLQAATAVSAAVASPPASASPGAAARAAKKAKAEEKKRLAALRASSSPRSPSFKAQLARQNAAKAATGLATSVSAGSEAGPSSSATSNKPNSPSSAAKANAKGNGPVQANGAPTASPKTSANATTDLAIPNPAKEGTTSAIGGSSASQISPKSGKRAQPGSSNAVDGLDAATSTTHVAASTGSLERLASLAQQTPPSTAGSSAVIAAATPVNGVTTAAEASSAPVRGRGRKRTLETAQKEGPAIAPLGNGASGSTVRAPSRTSGRQEERRANGIVAPSFAKKSRAKVAAGEQSSKKAARQVQDKAGPSKTARKQPTLTGAPEPAQIRRAGSCPADPAGMLDALLAFSKENPYTFKLDPRLAPRPLRPPSPTAAKAPQREVVRAVQQAQIRAGRIVKSSNVEFMQSALAGSSSRLRESSQITADTSGASSSKSPPKQSNFAAPKIRVAPALAEVPRMRKKAPRKSLGPLPILQLADGADDSSRASSMDVSEAIEERGRSTSTAQLPDTGTKRSREDTDEAGPSAPPKKKRSGWVGWVEVPEDSIKPPLFAQYPEMPTRQPTSRSQSRHRSKDAGRSRSVSKQAAKGAGNAEDAANDTELAQPAASSSRAEPLSAVAEGAENIPTPSTASRRAASPRVRDFGFAQQADDGGGAAALGVKPTSKHSIGKQDAVPAVQASHHPILQPSAQPPKVLAATSSSTTAADPPALDDPSPDSRAKLNLLASRGKQPLEIVPPSRHHDGVVAEGGSSPQAAGTGADVQPAAQANLAYKNPTAGSLATTAAAVHHAPSENGKQALLSPAVANGPSPGGQSATAGVNALAATSPGPSSTAGLAQPAPVGKQAWLAALAARAKAARAEAQPQPVTMERSARHSSRDGSSPLTTAPEEHDGTRRVPLIQSAGVQAQQASASGSGTHGKEARPAEKMMTSSPLTSVDPSQSSSRGKEQQSADVATKAGSAKTTTPVAASTPHTGSSTGHSASNGTLKIDKVTKRAKSKEVTGTGPVPAFSPKLPGFVPDSAVAAQSSGLVAPSAKAAGKRPEKASSAAPPSAAIPSAGLLTAIDPARNSAPPTTDPAGALPSSAAAAASATAAAVAAEAARIQTLKVGRRVVADLPINPLTGEVIAPLPKWNGWRMVAEDELAPGLFEQSPIISGKRARGTANYKET